MAAPDPTNKEDVSRWAAGITLGLSGPVADDLNTKPYFATGDHRIFYAHTFNQATAYAIHKLTAFQWKCCIEANDLKDIDTGKQLVELVESHLEPKAAGASAHGKLWFAKASKS
jgi:hypothetical protein